MQPHVRPGLIQVSTPLPRPNLTEASAPTRSFLIFNLYTDLRLPTPVGLMQHCAYVHHLHHLHPLPPTLISVELQSRPRLARWQRLFRPVLLQQNVDQTSTNQKMTESISLFPLISLPTFQRVIERSQYNRNNQARRQSKSASQLCGIRLLRTGMKG